MYLYSAVPSTKPVPPGFARPPPHLAYASLVRAAAAAPGPNARARARAGFSARWGLTSASASRTCRRSASAARRTRGSSRRPRHAHICTGTGPTPPRSAPGLGPPWPHLHRDWAHPAHICTGTGPTPAPHICTGTGPTSCHAYVGLRMHFKHVRSRMCVRTRTCADAHGRDGVHGAGATDVGGRQGEEQPVPEHRTARRLHGHRVCASARAHACERTRACERTDSSAQPTPSTLGLFGDDVIWKVRARVRGRVFVCVRVRLFVCLCAYISPLRAMHCEAMCCCQVKSPQGQMTVDAQCGFRKARKPRRCPWSVPVGGFPAGT